MEKLIEYINSMSLPERSVFEKQINTTINYLRRASSGKNRIGVNICIDIEKATNGNISCEDLRPDIDWQFLRSPQES